ncbi:MAG: two-component system sensor protein [Polyangiaceae bacterium]|jgi:two-component system sensor histidine kinase HydH|nr:two-component system sensor protein [Polyangiaceae bacterium]
MYELRTRTAVVCGALALAIAASVLLRGRPRRVHLLFSAFSATLGLWYLAQSFYGFFQATIWQRSTAIIAVLLPVLAVGLFEAMVPQASLGEAVPRGPRLTRIVWAGGALLIAAQLTPLHAMGAVRIAVFVYVFVFITLGLYELGQRGANSTSRATQRRVRFLVVIGAFAGLATIADFLWYLGLRTPPVGAVLSIVFVFALSQALESERLLDLSEMLGRLMVAAAVAFLIAFIFYVLLTVVGTFNTMYLNAVLAATVVLVVYEPLVARVEEQIRRFFFRERFDLEGALADARRRLVHTLEVPEMAALVMAALERSRRVTSAALYLRDQEGTGFDQIGTFGEGGPPRIEVATARMLLERLELGTVMLEEVESEVRERQRAGGRFEGGEAIMTAAEVLGTLRTGILIAIRDEQREIVGLLVLADRRVRDAISLEEIALVEQLATQIGIVIANSRSYQQMKERDRLALLGQMAAGLAHEIRNPLGAIKGAAQLLADPVPPGQDDGSTREFIGIILEEVDRLNRVVGSMLDLARPGDQSVVPVDVNGVARRTLQVLSAERTQPEVEVQLTLAADLPRVAIDPEQLRQVLMNLIKNGLQAVGQRGKVNVSTRVRFGRGTRSGKDGDAFVEITVADTGPGISSKTLDKLFLPFFTTKEKGTGLGLAISQRIVQSAGGRIEVRSYEGKGTTFTVVLPAVIDALGTPTPPPPAPKSGEPALRKGGAPVH